MVWSTSTAPASAPGERAVGAVDDLAHVVIVADAHHHELGALGRLGGRRRGPMPVQRHPGQRFLRRAVVDGDVVAGRGEVTGHRRPHHAEPNESNRTHRPSLAGHEITSVHPPVAGSSSASLSPRAAGLWRRHMMGRWSPIWSSIRRLAEGVGVVTELLGVAPTPGGSHVGKGTRNELLSLGGATYLEVIGPERAARPDGPARSESTSSPNRARCMVRATCTTTREIVSEARDGYRFRRRQRNVRRRPDEVLLEWELTVRNSMAPSVEHCRS